MTPSDELCSNESTRVTTAIGMAGHISVSSNAPGTGRPTDGGVGDFAGLLDAMLGNAASARHIGSASQPAQAAPASETEAELETLLAELLGSLDTLATSLKSDSPLDPEAVEDLENLLASIEELLGGDVPLPGPGAAIFTALSDLAALLGLDASGDDGPTAALDRLSQALARLADGVRQDVPGLAAGLTALSKTLDARSASLLAAEAETAATAINPRQIESDTRLNPVAAIAAARTENDAAPIKSAPVAEPGEDGDLRSLIKSDAAPQDRAATKPDAQPRPEPQPATAAMAAPSPDTDAPDGLTVAPPQTGAQTAAPAAAARPEAAAYQRPDTHINFPHIAAEISRHVQNGVSRFEIKLNPAELGRIDVRMEMDGSGNVIARLAVERSETLDLLQRDQRALMRALAEAGIDGGKTELEFSLSRDGNSDPSDGRDDASPHKHALQAPTDVQTGSTTGGLTPDLRVYARLDAVNLWV